MHDAFAFYFVILERGVCRGVMRLPCLGLSTGVLGEWVAHAQPEACLELG